MIDRSTTRSDGSRTRTEWTKSAGNWSKNVLVTTNVFKQSEVFTVSNGTGGDPNRKLPTTMGFSKQRITNGPGYSLSGNLSQNYIVIEGYGAVSGPSQAGKPTFSTDTTNLRNQVISKIGAQARGDLDLAIDLLEGRKTVEMINKATKVIKYIRGFHPRHWADRWLEYQYGWKPLVSSMYGTFNQIMQPPKMGRMRYEQRAREQSKKKSSTQVSGLPGINDTWVCDFSKRVEMKIELDFSNSTLQQLSGYTSLNPVGIAWELLPYSFVADWFFNIGGYLRCLENAFLLDLNFRSGYETTTTRLIELGNRAGTSMSGPDITTQSASTTRYTVTKQRSALGGFPVPARPTAKLDLGSSQILSGAALLYQFFGRR